MELKPSPVKEVALKLGLEVFQPEKINDSVDELQALDADIMIVMAYGQIVSQEVLGVPKKACLNVHTSLLPKYRGASPIQSAILAGDDETGVSLMKMELKMDAGAVYKTFPQAIEADTTASLTEKLAALTADKVPDALVEIANGTLEATPQNEDEVTYVTKISKADGNIDWSEDAEVIERKVRAFNPWPSAYTFFNGKRLKIVEAAAASGDHEGENGMVEEDGVVCATGRLRLMKVQLEGKKVQDYQEFLNGNQDFIGSVLKSS